MTELQWQDDAFSWSLFHRLEQGDLGSDRKHRLLAVGCCRRVWEWLKDERTRRAVVVAELYSDTLASDEGLAEAHAGATAARDSCHAYETVPLLLSSATIWVSGPSATLAACRAGGDILSVTAGDNATRSRVTFGRLVRCVFGNPFRPIAIDPAWLTSDVIALAEGIYQDRAFDRLPILADALQDAGCDNDDVLNHSRSEGPHCRGCWVVDLLTGRK